MPRDEVASDLQLGTTNVYKFLLRLFKFQELSPRPFLCAVHLSSVETKPFSFKVSTGVR